MNKYLLTVIFVFFVAVSNSKAEQGNGFQGLRWGSNTQEINKKFPKAKQSISLEKEYPICKKPDGTVRLCTISQQMCEDVGVLCHPSLVMKNYMVGIYLFDVAFEMSKQKTLSGVSLTYSGELIGGRKEHGRQIFEHLMESLIKKYGSPINSNSYAENKAGFMGGRYKWQTDTSRINLNYDGQFDVDHKILQATITIIYSPLIDDFSSKL